MDGWMEAVYGEKNHNPTDTIEEEKMLALGDGYVEWVVKMNMKR